MNNTINVTIPAQKFSRDKYIGNNCYLEEALRKIMPYNEINVSGDGHTLIDDRLYIPVKKFDFEIVRIAFSKNRDITVTLERIYDK